MKPERFITEYASFTRRKLDSNDLIRPEIRERLKKGITRAVQLRAQGLITADEAVCMIAGALA